MSQSKMFSERMREWFPDARMICECHRELDVCPADCTNLRAARERIREWADGVEFKG